jgi:hypothetical protein
MSTARSSVRRILSGNEPCGFAGGDPGLHSYRKQILDMDKELIFEDHARNRILDKRERNSAQNYFSSLNLDLETACAPARVTCKNRVS